jgi:hypothetical protein
MDYYGLQMVLKSSPVETIRACHQMSNPLQTLLSFLCKVQITRLDQEIGNGVVDVDEDHPRADRDFDGLHLFVFWTVS